MATSQAGVKLLDDAMAKRRAAAGAPASRPTSVAPSPATPVALATK